MDEPVWAARAEECEGREPSIARRATAAINVRKELVFMGRDCAMGGGEREDLSQQKMSEQNGDVWVQMVLGRGSVGRDWRAGRDEHGSADAFAGNAPRVVAIVRVDCVDVVFLGSSYASDFLDGAALSVGMVVGER